MAREIERGTVSYLRIATDTVTAAPARLLEDTEEFDVASLDERSAEIDLAQRYASGIVRFHRARTLLEKHDDTTSWQLVWPIIEELSPRDLPPAARLGFFKLTYFMQGELRKETLDVGSFRSQVLEIAGQIDRFLDEFGDLLPA